MENNEVKDSVNNLVENQKQIPFKKPLLIGKVGRLPRKLGNVNTVNKPTDEVKIDVNESADKSIADVADELSPSKPPPPASEEKAQLPYKEPSWSGLPMSCDRDYKLEVLKSGAIIDNINLMERAYWSIGRLETCDITMAHPTISRYHAVLQYKSENSEDQPVGFYLYDLSSTHGTFLNKNRIKPRVFARVQVGHMIKLGGSTRTFLLTGPEDDTEEETKLTVTELKAKRAEDLLKREQAEKEAALKRQQDEETLRKKIEERGVDWGMGEDADEETDLLENPFAQMNNEELYIDDPKKALRGFMEREGYDLLYDCNEQGMGQFICKVDLPLYDDYGKPIVVEVVHKGKKKEAVVQCALEACRLLDRHGLLRQATHESRKRKAKNWEENDFYDSDDDIFLDRTGSIEKKREYRMKTKVPQQPETYQSLMAKEKSLSEEIKVIEKQLSQSSKTTQKEKPQPLDEDSLESYMKELKQTKLDKSKISKLKTDLNNLKHEYGNVVKLINVARPADLPPLEPQHTEPSTALKKNKMPIFGKRLKVKVQKPERLEKDVSKMDADDDAEDDEDPENVQENFISQFAKIETSFKKIFPLMAIRHEEHLSNFWKTISKLPRDIAESREEVRNLFTIYIDGFSSAVLGNFSTQIEKIISDIQSMKTAHQIIDIGLEVIKFAKEVTHVANRMESVDDEKVENSIETVEKEEDIEKRKKKNQRRMQNRQEKAEVEKLKGYQEDASRDDYNMWVPPKNQTGDGRTSLNDKLGY